MPSYYTVVQYVPDPIIDERINIGVIVAGEGRLRSRFLQNWRRVRSFGAENIAFLQDFANQLTKAGDAGVVQTGESGVWRLDEEALKRMAWRWINSIQFTPPLASLDDPDKLISDLASRFLHQQQRVRPALRTKRTAVKIAVHGIEAALMRHVGDKAQELVKRDRPVEGQFARHQFDVAVENGKLFCAVQGLSFEVKDPESLSTQLGDMYWAIDDVRKRDKGLPLAVVTLPPKTEPRQYREARRIFRGLGASVVAEDEVERWATDIAKRAAKELLASG